jgi:hypothetical protein
VFRVDADCDRVSPGNRRVQPFLRAPFAVDRGCAAKRQTVNDERQTPRFTPALARMAPEGPLDFVTATLGARDPFKIDSG